MCATLEPGLIHRRCRSSRARCPEKRSLKRQKLTDFLDSASEDEFTERLLVPLFQRLGFYRVSAAGHKEKTLEFGKDLWMKAQRFRLGVEALRLSLAYEYDPYFSLSIARVDPLPHQLEAVYQYFMAMPRIRFLLADDPGAARPSWLACL
jgi:hypothetical protein